MHSYPYRLTGDSVKSAVRNALCATLDAWSKEWFALPPTFEVVIETTIQTDAEWLISSEDEDRWTAIRSKDRAAHDFLRLLFGTSTGAASSALAEQAWTECIGDLMQRVVPDKLRFSTNSLSQLRTGIGSGALYASIDGALPVCGVAFGGAFVEAMSAAALVAPVLPSLTPRSALIGNAKLGVELKLGEAEMPLTELSGIAVGDILALDVPYLDPLQLRTTAGQGLCKVHLGRIGPNKAIQVISK